MQSNSAMYSLKNEDKCICCSDSNVYGIADGHGGPAAAKLCRDHICASKLSFDSNELIDLFHELHTQCLKLPCNSGASLTICMINDDESSVLCANVGDVLAMIITPTSYYWITTSHRLQDNPSERMRVSDRVQFLCQSGRPVGPPRLFPGGLSCSRTIGDANVPGTACVPDITYSQNLQDDDIMLIASDGLWDTMSLRKIIDVTRATRCAKSVISSVSNRLADDASVIVVSKLPRARSPRRFLRNGSGSSISSDEDSIPCRTIVQVSL